VTKKRTVEDVYSMEDSAYRDLMREELKRARRTQAVPTSGGGMATVAITLFLLIATAAIFLHHFGIIELPK
jgi:hypothetical protein